LELTRRPGQTGTGVPSPRRPRRAPMLGGRALPDSTRFPRLHGQQLPGEVTSYQLLRLLDDLRYTVRIMTEGELQHGVSRLDGDEYGTVQIFTVHKTELFEQQRPEAPGDHGAVVG